jgi:branched-chain amino acid transport system substrate-binding protein
MERAIPERFVNVLLAFYENVSAMMGLSDTDMVRAAVPVAAGAGIPFVTSGATSPGLAEEYEGLFLACFGDNVQAAAGAEYAYNEMGLKTCSLLVDGNMEYARLLAGYFKERYLDLGGEIIMEAFINDSRSEESEPGRWR